MKPTQPQVTFNRQPTANNRQISVKIPQNFHVSSKISIFVKNFMKPTQLQVTAYRQPTANSQSNRQPQVTANRQ